MIPAGLLLRELVLAFGGALFVGNLAVVVREWRRKAGDDRPKPNMALVGVSVLIGAVMTIWGAASLAAA